jgi:Uma2 family endonuclease
VLVRLLEALRSYVRVAAPAFHVFASAADISWSDDMLVQPDVFVVPVVEARTLDWARIKDLQLVIEVLSPTSTRADRFTKRRLYQERRVPRYWAVDAQEQLVEVWTPQAQFPQVERQRIIWSPRGASRPFTLELAELFQPI